MMSAVVGLGAQPAQAAITPAAAVPIKAAHSDKCLNIQGGTTANDVALVQYNCSDAFTNDKFRVVPAGTGTYQIVANFSGKCLNVYKGTDDNNTPVHQYTCSATATNNLWRFVPVAGRSAFRIVSVKSGKCLNVYNNSQVINAAVNIYTCSTSETALNDQFSFPPAAGHGAGVAVSSVANTPVYGVQGGPGAAAVGPLVYSYVTDGGRLYRGYQASPDNFFDISWQGDPGLEGYAGHPAVNVHADGRVVIAAQSSGDGDLDLSTQGSANNPPFSDWQDVGGSSPAGAAQPVTAKLPNNSLVTFAIIGGQLWHLPQDGTNLPYGAWRNLGGSGLTGEVATGLTRTGLRVFARDSSGVLQTALYSGGKLGDFVSLGGSGFTGRIGEVVRTGYFSRVVMRAADGSVVTKAETSEGTFEADWTTIPGVTAAGSPAVVMDPASGKTAIVVRGTDNTVYYTQETAEASGQWMPWVQAEPRVIATDPTVMTYTRRAGAAWVYIVRDSVNVVYAVGVTNSLARKAKATSKAGSKVADGAMPTFTPHTLPAAPKD
jgi:hypothetical protein